MTAYLGALGRRAGAVAAAGTGSVVLAADGHVELVAALTARLDCQVIAEGRYGAPAQVRAAFAAGAFAVVVGTAITDPLALTRRFAAATPAGAEKIDEPPV